MANEEHLKTLKQGVKVWNTWREENKDVQPDLNEADLIRADLRDANLTRAKLAGVKFDRALITPDQRSFFGDLLGEDELSKFVIIDPPSPSADSAPDEEQVKTSVDDLCGQMEKATQELAQLRAQGQQHFDGHDRNSGFRPGWKRKPQTAGIAIRRQQYVAKTEGKGFFVHV
jgi:hypothetical protein